jgi:hypothetical protein
MCPSTEELEEELLVYKQWNIIFYWKVSTAICLILVGKRRIQAALENVVKMMVKFIRE